MPNISLESLDGPYLRDILDQPRAVEQTVAALAHEPELDRLHEGLKSGQWRRIVLTGMGGSWAILEPLHMSLVRSGFECVIAETSELVYSTPALLGSGSVVVAVSQSGASAEIVRMLDRKAGAYILGVTNTEGSPLDRRADFAVRTRAGVEAAVSCKTAVAAMAALHWIGAHLGGSDLEHARAGLDALPAAMRAYLDGWRSHVLALASRLDGVRDVFIAGRGRSLAAALMGGMIQKEAAHVHGEGLGSAALRHGPFEILSPEVFVLVFEGDPEVSAMNRGLVRDAEAAGARAALCAFEGEGPFALPPVPVSVRPVMEMLPPQIMTLALAALRGRRPGVFEKITKVTAIE